MCKLMTCLAIIVSVTSPKNNFVQPKCWVIASQMFSKQCTFSLANYKNFQSSNYFCFVNLWTKRTLIIYSQFEMLSAHTQISWLLFCNLLYKKRNPGFYLLLWLKFAFGLSLSGRKNGCKKSCTCLGLGNYATRNKCSLIAG